MESVDLSLSLWRTLNLWLLPVCYTGFSLVAWLVELSNERLWQLGRSLTAACLAFALLALLNTCIAGSEILPFATLLKTGQWGAISLSARADMIGNLFLLMVNLVAWVIVGFSSRYLNGETGQRRFVIALFMTLAAVNLVVITNNVAVLAIAWVVTSLAMHALLTFYSSRTQATFAAHKKFLVSRIADLCLFCAIGLIAQQTGSLELDQIKTEIGKMALLPTTLQIAALLLAFTAALKCAQLPFHGWLIQVMEAPTPVSALLHAGVVNLGGFLLIRFSFLMAGSASAQIFLVCIGSATTVIAALVMMTRISIKVSLAWSTCAQMGFMLMQCGLGAYELAALHLLAHSLYKAHAFLNAGSTNARLTLMSVPSISPGLANRLASGVAGLLIVVALLYLTHQKPSVNDPLFAFAVIVGLALAPLLSFKANERMIADTLKFALYSGGVVLIYLGMHRLFADYLGLSVTNRAGWMSFRVTWVVLLFGALYVLQSIVLERPDHALSKRLYPLFYGGLFLDDLFTRLTFWIWPAPTRSTAPNQHAMLTQSKPVLE